MTVITIMAMIVCVFIGVYWVICILQRPSYAPDGFGFWAFFISAIFIIARYIERFML